MNRKTKKKLRHMLAMLLAALMIFGALPLETFAAETSNEDATASSISIPQYVYYLDGTLIPITDERIESVAPIPYITVGLGRNQNADSSPHVSLMTSFVIPHSSMPTGITVYPYGTPGGSFEMDAFVYMNNTLVQARRYFVIINGVHYEAYCADPNQPGPGSTGAAYQLTGEAEAKFLPILRYGFPVNPSLSNTSLSEETRRWNAYTTRVAVAYVSRPNATFTVGGNPLNVSSGASGISAAVYNRVNAPRWASEADFENLHPAIIVNGERHAEDIGRTISTNPASSIPFDVTFTRRTLTPGNPFRFVWDMSSTPVGSRLYVDGNFIAEAPNNPSQIFAHTNSGSNQWVSINSFNLTIPNTPANIGAEARVELVGINNEYAGRVWQMNHRNAAGQVDNSWQDIIFYIPEALSSAVFSFAYEPIVENAYLRIIKTGPQGNRLAGAVFHILDEDGNHIQGSPATIPASGEWVSEPLPPGTYTITEVSPPPSHSLDPTPQTVTIEAGQTGVVERTFVNQPTTTPTPTPRPNGITIQKVCAVTRENIPGALMRLSGMSSAQVVTEDGQLIEIDNTGINVSQVLTNGATTAVPGGVTSTVRDGVWILEGLPYGFYMVEEERAPEGFSLYPQHTAFGFWKLPPNVFIDSPDGDFYIIDKDQSTNHILITFENYPFGCIEVFKRESSNGIGNNQLLAGATFRIQGFYPGNPAIPIDRTGVTDANGRLVFCNLPAGQFTITEISPPSGYMLGDNNSWSVNLGWGQRCSSCSGSSPATAPSHTFFNVPKSSIEILKVCAITGEYLAGAIFEIYDPTTGERWQATTGANGIATIGRGTYGNFLYPGRTYIIREITAPPGFFRSVGPREIVLSPGDENRITWVNYPFGEVIIYKREMSNGVGNNQLLPGAHFRIQGFYPGEPPIPIDRVGVTDENGRLVFSHLPAGQFTITEVAPPSGFLLGENNVWVVNVMWGQTIESGLAQSHTFFNAPKSSLEVLKIDGVSNEPLAGAIFELYDPTTGETWQATSDANGIARFGVGSYGNFLYPGRTYILREIVAPDGFVLASGPREIVLSPGNENRVTWRNWRNPGLTIIKLCQDTGERLAGAHFSIVAQGSGRPLPTDFPMITDENGEIHIPWTLFEGEAERNFIVTETVPPPGFHLSDPNWQLVTLQAGYDNTVVFANRRKPNLTIHKTDSVTGANIQGAEFTIERLSPAPAGMLTGNPFRTNAQGQIVLPNLPAGVYRIVETRAAANYWLDPQVANRTWTITIRENEDYLLQVQNTLLPTLVITKMNAVTHRPVPLTHFRVYFEVPNTANVVRIGDFVTNENGQIILPFVEVGWYRFIETRPAPGMSLATNNSFRVFLSPGQNTYQLMRQGLLPSNADIPDVTGDFDPPDIPEQYEPLPPSIVNPDDIDTDNIEYVDDADLVARVTDSLVVTGGGDWLVGEGVWNFPLNSIVIKKTCSVTRQLLVGATFEVIHTSAGVSGTLGTVIGRYTTDPSGIIVLTGLIPGSYVVREVQPPNNFTLSVTNTQTVFLQPDGHSVVEIVFANDPYGSLLIAKRCEVSGRPLANAQFRVTNSSGAVVGTANGLFTTNAQGEILVPNLRPDSYIVTEIRAPDGFVLNSTPQTIRVNATGNTYRLEFTNSPMSSLIIRKVSIYDGSPLANARFTVQRVGGEQIGDFATNNHGLIEVPGILGTFIVTETSPPPGYSLATNNVRTVEVRPGAPTTVVFENPRLSNLMIRKICGNSGSPLAGVVFEISHISGERVRNPANNSFEFVTNSAGLIHLPRLAPGSYVARETRALPGYIPADPYFFTVTADQDTVITIRNYKRPSVVVRKICGETRRPLPGVEFEFARYFGNGRTGERLRNPADGSFTFVTDSSGHIYLPTLEHGVYIAIETRPLPGFAPAEPTIFTVDDGGDLTVIIRNYPIPALPDFAILKLDGATRRPLQGVHFEIAHYLGQGRAGERLVNPADRTNTFVTDAAGLIPLPGIAPGMYIAIETRALPGYTIDGPVVFTVGEGENRVITIYNHKRADWVIRKTDGDTGRPLQGVRFEVARYFGNGNAGERLRNPVDGSTTFTTNEAGLIHLPNLEPGTFIAIETRALPGYVLAEPVIFVVREGAENTTIDVRNYRRPGLTIRKINSVTRQPIEGVIFEISRPNGERIQNPQTGFFEFRTDRNGIIHLPELQDGTYLVTETRPAPGYFGLDEPILVEINAQTRRQDHLLVVENTPASGLLIVKTCASTGRPLQGVEFDIRHADGRRVRGLIADQNQPNTLANSPNLTATGGFVTDHRGRIHLNHLEPGVYHITEVAALPGFLLDTTVHVVTITPGRLSTLEVVNVQMAGIRLLKICSVTRQPIPGVEFRVYDFITRREVAGPFITDNNGVIDFTGILPPGRYTILETRAAQGFLRDDQPRTVEFRAGMVTEITWENTPMAGQIQITKLSNADNQMNGFPAGTRLQGAVFEVRNHRTGNVVDQFTTGPNGVGVSRPLPLGRYTIHEIVAPQFYRLSDVVLDITIEHSGQIVRYNFYNAPTNLGVDVRKTGPVEVMGGQQIIWDITRIANSSTVPLSDFFFRDVLPTDAVRLTQIFTGTFNQSLRYSILFRTNRNNDWRVAYDNLDSTRNNGLSMAPAALGLASNEYVTEIMFQFGTVRAGFRSVEAPRIVANVREGLPHGFEFANRVDVGGRHGSEWVIGNHVWITRIFRRQPGQHPRTGY